MKTELKNYFQILVLLTVIVFGSSIILPDNNSDFICTEICADTNPDSSDLNSESESVEDVFEIQKIVFNKNASEVILLQIKVNSSFTSHLPLSIWQPPRI